MIKHIKNNKPHYTEVKGDDLLSKDFFYYPEYQGSIDELEDWNVAFHSNLGSLTVVDRMTGFGNRDVESGYRNCDGEFWLASGGYNVMEEFDGEKVSDAIEFVKRNANTCIGHETIRKGE